MSETSNGSLTLDALTIGDPISQHHGVKCCPAIRETTDERYIVKILSIPASSVQLDALLLTGAYPTPAHALEYFRERAEEVLKEVEILKRLHAMEGFLPFTHAEVRKNEDNTGYQVYLISPYKRSLERQMQLEPLTHLGAVNLGLDLCAALAICRRAGYLYIDLKPSNVYFTPNQGYRISDLGFVPLKSLKYASYPEQHRSAYTAPEITDAMSALNDRIDIYALGLILYQVYNNGELPAQTDSAPTPPAYADYEMAEIILKACDPDPGKRWSDPLQMGQAIVAYMQRNSVNDTPIVPPPVQIPEAPQEEEPQQTDTVAEAEVTDDSAAMLDSILDTDTVPEAIAEDAPETEAADEPVTEGDPVVVEVDTDEDPDLDLSFIVDLSDDETVPTEESAAEIKIDLVSDEVQDMLARADELLLHELPEPAVAPEPIEVPFPAPIVLMDDAQEVIEDPSGEVKAEELPQETDQSEDAVTEAEETAETDTTEQENTEDDSDYSDEEDDWDDTDPELQVSEYYSDIEQYEVKRTRGGKSIIIIAACVLLLAAMITGGVLFYQYYYLQNVAAFNIDGSVDSLTVIVSSAIKDDLLTVVCTDTYGNTRTEEVINGRAHFADLTPNTQYRVQLNISGFHRLVGITTGSYTTAAQTEILNLNAVAGPEDGSVILSFAVNGPDTENWTVSYSTGNSPEMTQRFNGHSVTITDLIIGSEYLFRLIPSDDQYLTGTWMIRYTAQQIVYAQELIIRSCAEGTLVAVWNAPEGSEGQSWNVRCYNNNGYDQTITTTDSQAQFTELDHAYGYTVEVTAVGMTQSTTATVSANPVTITSISATPGDNDALTLKWDYIGEAPAEGWILDYTIDGGAPMTLSCTETSAQLNNYPGSVYEFDVRPVGDSTCYNNHLSYETAEAAMFSNYGVTANDMRFYMCRTPNKKNWDRFDVPRSEYTESFKIGEKASFLVELRKDYEKSTNDITVTYIIRDEAGVPVSLNSESSTWKKLWDKKFCELDIPQMPETAGNYTIDIYFNGQQINKDVLSFSVT